MKYESITVVGNDNDTVKVEQSRVIRLDDTFFMVPSLGYAGVEQGRVTVLDIGTPVDLGNINEEYSKHIEEYTELDMQNYEEDTTNYEYRKNVLEYGLWVVYQYPDTDDTLVFPIEEFLDHSVRMF